MRQLLPSPAKALRLVAEFQIILKCVKGHTKIKYLGVMIYVGSIELPLILMGFVI